MGSVGHAVNIPDLGCLDAIGGRLLPTLLGPVRGSQAHPGTEWAPDVPL